MCKPLEQFGSTSTIAAEAADPAVIRRIASDVPTVAGKCPPKGQPDAGHPAAIGRAHLATAGEGMSQPRNLCQCGKPKEAVALVCRACYLSSVRQPIKTRKQAAAEAARELWDYWPIWEHSRRRAA